MPRSFIVLSALALLSAAVGLEGARAQSPQPAAQSRPAGKLAWPVVLPNSQNSARGDDTGWSRGEIDAARARCNALLANIEFVAVPADPMREGECGAPAAVELISIGRSPQVTLSAPSIVSCDMVVALDTWIKTDVQPAARELLGSAVVRLDVMSSYSCRNAYGRKKSRLSEHGRANALDIKAFMLQRGDTVDVLADWGTTERDHRKHIAAEAAASKAAAARAEAIKREAEKAQAVQQAKSKAEPSASANVTTASTTNSGDATRAERQVPSSAPAKPVLRGTLDDPAGAAADVKVHIPGRRFSPSISLGQPSQLGGPKAKSNTETAMSNTGGATPSARQRFLRRIHASACRTFGTTLGPEANEAHRNHFHIDMAERQSGSFCE